MRITDSQNDRKWGRLVWIEASAVQRTIWSIPTKTVPVWLIKCQNGYKAETNDSIDSDSNYCNNAMTRQQVLYSLCLVFSPFKPFGLASAMRVVFIRHIGTLQACFTDGHSFESLICCSQRLSTRTSLSTNLDSVCYLFYRILYSPICII